MVLRTDGQELNNKDLDQLAESCGQLDHFTEDVNDIEVLGIDNMESLPNGYERVPIRQYFSTHDDKVSGQVARGKALLEWRNLTHYCGKCGAPLEEDKKLTARVCPKCGNLIFPRIEPCVITLVHKDGNILLANHVQRNQNIYACIAGFVEAGETIEQAVEREIYEETHLKVKNVRYFGSQSWPFPSQLMLGFEADYASGEIELQREEIADAQWFDPEHCPASPQPGSIAYRLIEASKKRK